MTGQDFQGKQRENTLFVLSCAFSFHLYDIQIWKTPEYILWEMDVVFPTNLWKSTSVCLDHTVMVLKYPNTDVKEVNQILALLC